MDESVVDYEELFKDQDWSNCDYAALSTKHQAELIASELASIQTLQSVSEQAGQLVPAFARSLMDVSALQNVLGEYRERLKGIGAEIMQLEAVNRGLKVQTTNQGKLLSLLDAIIGQLTVDEQHLEVLQSREAAFNVEAIKEAAEAINVVQRLQLEDGLQGIKAVQDRLAHYDRIKAEFAAHLASHFATLISKSSNIPSTVNRNDIYCLCYM